jgi:hypothetical protein
MALLFGAFGCQQDDDEYDINYLVDYVGKVQDSTGEAIGGVAITYEGLATPITADADGAFRIPNLKPGEKYKFIFTKDGYVSASFETTVIVDYGQLTSPKEGVNINQLQDIDNIRLHLSGAELIGYVFHKADANGITAPYKDVKVVFEPLSDYGFATTQYEAVALTDANGYYRITNLSKNIYGTLKAYSGDKLIYTRSSSTEEGESHNITETNLSPLTVLSTNFESKTLAPDAKLFVNFNQSVKDIKNEIEIELYSYSSSEYLTISDAAVTLKEGDDKTLVVDLTKIPEIVAVPASTNVSASVTIYSEGSYLNSYSFNIQK